MVIDKTGRSLMRSGFGVMHATNRFRLMAIVSVVVAGCSSSKSPPPVERDACLEAGPAKSVDYDNCVRIENAKAGWRSKRFSTTNSFIPHSSKFSRPLKATISHPIFQNPPHP